MQEIRIRKKKFRIRYIGFQGQNRRFKASEEGYWKNFLNLGSNIVKARKKFRIKYSITKVSYSKILKTISAYTKSTDQLL